MTHSTLYLVHILYKYIYAHIHVMVNIVSPHKTNLHPQRHCLRYSHQTSIATPLPYIITNFSWRAGVLGLKF